MPETPRREFDARRETELGVTREFRVGCAILQEVISGDVTLQCCEKVLSRDAMACTGTIIKPNNQSQRKGVHEPASSKTIG